MSGLTAREKELVAIGAAIGSNCVPCVEYHIPQARKVGLPDTLIFEAILIAESVKKIPAENVYKTALGLVTIGDGAAHEKEKPCGCQQNPKEKRSKCC